MREISIHKVSITELNTDAIVNAANEGLWAGSGVCGAIFQAAGYDELQEACRRIGHCDTGSAVITPGFRLPAKFVIHAVGPRWSGGKRGEPDLLRGAYERSLELALANGCRSIGFPLISAGIYGYPMRQAWACALRTCAEFLDRIEETDFEIIFAVIDSEVQHVGQQLLAETEAGRYAVAKRSDWKTLDMPEQHEEFVLHWPLDERQMEALRHGYVPQAMEEKWFWFMEGDTLFAHRSWTGYCIYRVEFRADGDHAVTVNRDPGQYTGSDAAEDAETLRKLLEIWARR